jgi:acetoin utilization deacetylase AcuC-like enzyme
MVERSRRSSGATLAACRVALAERIGINLAGGTHHAMSAAGEGYCVFNDAAVAIRTLLKERVIQRATVIDCDVHQGNGTAEILGRDSNVFTFSIHGEKNFPWRKSPSHLDIDLPDQTNDETYLEKLSYGLDVVFEQGSYDLAIYLAGADPFVSDRLGRLSLTKSGLRRRDEVVLDRLNALGIPVAIAMAGGYAPDVNDIVDIHAATISIGKRVFDYPN